ncbi:LpxI family protein [Desulfurobacterium thermolithotrophum]|uniref:LpxI family protein n=1 Tax=Desulfurobacterium thermolithotrophum TaxID=64160 RepID=UPI0013D4DB22|nr:UDP-2,3-diacylglucosamine diphosphatase LpxI [Desulfurobacterium thermolithotrophum]
MKVGLLAGKGELPLEFLKSAKEKDIRTITFSLEGITSPEVERYSDKVIWIKPFKLGKFLKTLKKEEIREIAILGKVEHKNAISLSGFDLKALTFIASLKDRKPETIIKGIISEIENIGVRVIEPTEYLLHLFQEPGIICGNLTDKLKEEVEFGMKIAKEIASLDIGQTVVVKDRTVIAVEGIEGTDKCIERGAELAGEGFVVCKAARKNQDMRVDVPTIGAKTIELIGKLKGRALIFEANKTFLLNKEEVKKLSRKYGITVVAV